MSSHIDDALLEEIRDRSDIVSVVGDYVSLRKAGNSYKGLCPFHSEKTPSFTVHPNRNFFYCFGCQTGGDVITFLRELNGYSFREAVRHLAERVGIHIPEARPSPGPPGGPRRAQGRSPGPSNRRATKDACYRLGRAAQAFYADALGAVEGSGCRDYLRGRGLGREAVQRFGLGFAPDRWEALGQALAGRGDEIQLAETLGLVAPRKSGRGWYDRFRNRLMFPIRNIAGEVIAFSGRDLSGDEQAAKYINSPESPVYTKGDGLYGLFEARRSMRSTGRAVLVEGNVDLVALSMAGIEEVVAPLGTALTEPQCRLLKRFVSRVVLLFDGDNAGRAATLKAIPVALGQGLSVAVAELPDGEDPDSFLKAAGAERVRELIDQARPGWDYLVDHAIHDADAFADPRGPVRVADRLAPLLASIDDPRERRMYQRSLAHTLGLDEPTMAGFLRRAPRERRPYREAPTSSPPGGAIVSLEGPPPRRELELLTLMLMVPQCCALYVAHELSELLTHRAARAAADDLARRWEDERQVDAATFAAGLDDAGLRAHLYQSLASTGEIADWSTPFEQLETGLKIDFLVRRTAELSREYSLAARRGDEAETERIFTEKSRIQQEVNLLRGTRGARWQS